MYMIYERLQAEVVCRRTCRTIYLLYFDDNDGYTSKLRSYLHSKVFFLLVRTAVTDKIL